MIRQYTENQSKSVDKYLSLSEGTLNCSATNFASYDRFPDYDCRTYALPPRPFRRPFPYSFLDLADSRSPLGLLLTICSDITPSKQTSPRG